MAKKMLIDAAHQEELRVVVLNDDRIEDFEVETAGKEQIKGNLYVGEITRVEPSLQAAFIDYGGNRNGFLAFGEIHPMWFDLPAEEKEELLKELRDIAERKQNARGDDNADDDDNDDAEEDDTEKSAAETLPPESSDLSPEELAEDMRALALANGMTPEASEDDGKGRKKGKKDDDKNERKAPIHRRYNMQDVVKEGGKILVQIVKEERGTKGAALTTYYALPGRFTVLMPNTPYAGGISRKITDHEERKKLREAVNELDVPANMGLIVRTAGIGQEKEAVKRDFNNLTALWQKIEKEMKDATPPECVHEDGSLVVRALRDMFTDDVGEVLIAGRRAYRSAKDFAKSLMPDEAKLVKEYRGQAPLFSQHNVQQELNQMHRTRVTLPSGGYLIINPTEALVAIDINSGRATQERNLEETAYKTNLEAAEEIARQVRLRDLSGLIVVDFIDMEDRRNERNVERAMRKAIRRDRARIQVGGISSFGLMEISRQRLRPSFGESIQIKCPTCNGTGHVPSLASSALMLLRSLEEENIRGNADRIIITTSADLCVFLLNHKRELIREMEAKYKFQILVRADDSIIAPDYKLELVRVKADGSESTQTINMKMREEPEEVDNRNRYSKGNSRRKGGGKQSRGGRDKDNNKGKDNDNRKPRRGKSNDEEKGAKTRRPRRASRDSDNDNAQSNAPAKEEALDVSKPKAKTEDTAAEAPKEKRTGRRPRRATPVQNNATSTTKTDEAADKKQADESESKGKATKAKAKTSKAKKSDKPKVEDKPLLVEKIDVDGSEAGASQAKNKQSKGFQRWWAKSG